MFCMYVFAFCMCVGELDESCCKAAFRFCVELLNSEQLQSADAKELLGSLLGEVCVCVCEHTSSAASSNNLSAPPIFPFSLFFQVLVNYLLLSCDCRYSRWRESMERHSLSWLSCYWKGLKVAWLAAMDGV